MKPRFKNYYPMEMTVGRMKALVVGIHSDIETLADALLIMAFETDKGYMRLDHARIWVDRLLFGKVARLMQVSPVMFEDETGYKEYTMAFTQGKSTFLLWTT